MKKHKKQKKIELISNILKAYVACSFKRTKNGEWERGLAILKPENIGVSDVQKILDVNNRIVKRLWDYSIDRVGQTIIDGHYCI